jgi:hypothetical protein
MYLDVDSLVGLAVMRQADIRREVAGYHLVEEARKARSTDRGAVAAWLWRGFSMPGTVVARFLAGPARRPVV